MAKVLYQTHAEPVLVPEDVAKSMAWAPEYPDQVERPPDVHAAQSQALAAPTSDDPLIRVFAESWLPGEPDVIRPPTPITMYEARGPPQLLLPDELIRPFELSWLPSYPDRAPGPIPITQVQSTELVLDDAQRGVSALPEIGWLLDVPVVVRRTPQAPEGFYVSSPVEGFPPEVFFPGTTELVIAGRKTLYQSVAKPVDVPAVAPDIGWLVGQPDVVRRVPQTPEQFAIGQPPELIRPFELSWVPDYPSILLPARAPVGEGQFSWNPQTPTPFEVFSVSGTAIIVGKGTLYQAYAKPLLPPEALPEIGWLPDVPIVVRAIPPTLEGFFTLGESPELIRDFGISWQASYPDQLLRPAIHAQGFFATDPSPVAALPDIGWFPNMPDVVRRIPPASEGLFAIGQPDSLIRDFGISWAPTYPSILLPPRGVLSEGISVRDITLPPFFDIGWLPNQADVVRPVPQTQEGLFVIGQPDELTRDFGLSWKASWPDQLLPKAGVHPQGFFATDPRGLILPDIGWLPTQPDVIRPRHQVDPGLFALGQPPELIRPFGLGWLPEYPSILLPPKGVFQQGVFAKDLIGIILPDIDWIPNAPDVVRPIPPTMEGWFALGQPDALIRDFGLSWRSSWPDQLLPPLRVITEGFAKDLTPPALPDIGWFPRVTDVVRPLHQTQTGLFVLGEEPSLIRAFGLSWSPTYPSLLVPERRPVDTGHITQDLQPPGLFNIGWLSQLVDMVRATPQVQEGHFVLSQDPASIRSFGTSWFGQEAQLIRAPIRSLVGGLSASPEPIVPVVAPEIPFFQVPDPVMVRRPLIEYTPATELVLPDSLRPEVILIDKWYVQHHNPPLPLPEPVREGHFVFINTVALAGTAKAITVYVESGVLTVDAEAGTLVIYTEAGTVDVYDG